MRRKYLGWWKERPFMEEQIQAKAYEIWEKRGRQGTPEENWQAAIAELRRERSLLWKLRRLILLPFRLLTRLLQFLWLLPGHIYRFVRLALRAETSAAALDVIKVVISAFGVLATIFAGVGLYLTYQNSQAERQLNIDRLVTDRFAKAVEQLGSKDIHVRLGAIYSLERIAKDSPKDHWTVMEVLTAYVRNKSPLPKKWLDTPVEKRKALPKVETDVQSAFTVIGRREIKNDPEGEGVDLSASNLSGAELFRAELRSANLRGADLSGAKVNGAYFSSANLRGADLSSAYLIYADLRDAYFSSANLRGAYLIRADLSDADLSYADLSGSNLRGTNLSSADLSSASLRNAKNITPDQIKQAHNWRKAYYDPDFRKQLGLPPEK